MESCASCYRPLIVGKSIDKKDMSFVSTNGVAFSVGVVPQGTTITTTARAKGSRVLVVRASAVDSYESSSDFAKRMEKAWVISQQPRPIACSSCNSKGHVECTWCGGTGFFILGDNMLCQVPSKNTSCVICSGKGSKCCSDCKGTGFRAKWLGGQSLIVKLTSGGKLNFSHAMLNSELEKVVSRDIEALQSLGIEALRGGLSFLESALYRDVSRQKLPFLLSGKKWG